MDLPKGKSIQKAHTNSSVKSSFRKTGYLSAWNTRAGSITVTWCQPVNTVPSYVRVVLHTKSCVQQQDHMLREQFSSEVSVYDTEVFILVDETRSDAWNKLRKRGYSIWGKPPWNQTFLVRGECIACMSSARLLNVITLKGTANGELLQFVQSHLLPHVMPFNGINPHSVVVLDNCSIHHIPEEVASIHDVGALALFLPPYSPDFNPIEELFSNVKTTLRTWHATHYRLANSFAFKFYSRRLWLSMWNIYIILFKIHAPTPNHVYSTI